MGEIAALVLLKLFINSMKNDTQVTPSANERNSVFKCKQHTINDLRGTKI